MKTKMPLSLEQRVNSDVPENEIRVEIQDCASQQSNFYTCSRVKLGRLFNAYIESRGLSPAQVKFSFEDGRPLAHSSFDRLCEGAFKGGKVNVVLAQVIPDRYSAAFSHSCFTHLLVLRIS
jgi:hypothetical protein